MTIADPGTTVVGEAKEIKLAGLGIPTAEEATALYCSLTGREGLPGP